MNDKRYFIETAYYTKGPYTIEQLRTAVRESALSRSALVRGEDETEARPVEELLRALRIEAQERKRAKLALMRGEDETEGRPPEELRRTPRPKRSRRKDEEQAILSPQDWLVINFLLSAVVVGVIRLIAGVDDPTRLDMPSTCVAFIVASAITIRMHMKRK